MIWDRLRYKCESERTVSTVFRVFCSGFDKLAKDSPLSLCGYTVEQKKGLSPIQRREILEYIINHDILEKYLSIKKKSEEENDTSSIFLWIKS